MHGSKATVADFNNLCRQRSDDPSVGLRLSTSTTVRSLVTSATIAILLTMLSLSGCSDLQSANSVYREDLVTAEGQPAYITVQHCLIGFKGSVQGKVIMRSEAEAETLAQELFAKAQAGEDFNKIVVAHTDDSAPGIYRMANDGFPGDTTSRVRSKHIMSRSQMVAAFGDVGFDLDVGEVGLAPFDQATSPFGWHIIKRIK